jgi:putative addiction module killer protein
MYIVKTTTYFSKWLKSLKDLKGKIAIARRIERAQAGNLGDYKSLGNSLFELRITVGPGYRVYFTKQKNEIIILLIGGDKSTQSKDIKKAQDILKEIKNER